MDFPNIIVFTRDLRVRDNPALEAAVSMPGPTVALFVFGALKEIYVNWLWFSATETSQSVNYLPIYKTVLSAKITFFY